LVFKRRDRRPILEILTALIYPRGGWSRAAQYLRHRVRRLPDTPGKISRGIWAGVFVCFTPLFGLHFICAALLAWVIRGNVLASLMATFFGNPFTFPAIGFVSINLGSWIIGGLLDDRPKRGPRLEDIDLQIWSNIKAIFTDARIDWNSVRLFYDVVFVPYLVGGIIPGLIAATMCYYLALPVITAYQTRRKKRLRAKLQQLKTKSASTEE